MWLNTSNTVFKLSAYQKASYNYKKKALGWGLVELTLKKNRLMLRNLLFLN